ncbi:MAG: hypothetical protein AAF968_17285 [Pseudomonadota bacterium]
MKTIIAASVAVITLATALPSEARDGNSSLRDFNKWRAEMPEGGYVNPLTALYDAVTGKNVRTDVVKRNTQSSKGARGYTGN